MTAMTYLLHALSPLHAGTGQAMDVIDLPIARLRATGMPYVPGSSLKGVLREACAARLGENDDRLLGVFGPEVGNASDHAGALIVGDARLLALPVRSFRGTFAWITSPLLLRLAGRDRAEGGAGSALPLPSFPDGAGPWALVADRGAAAVVHDNRLFLEDLDLPVQQEPQLAPWAAALGRALYPEAPELFTRRFAVVDDETMTFLWETAVQIDTRVRIDPETGTVAEGALWTEESLPAETVLVGLVLADRPRRSGVDGLAEPRDVLEVAVPEGAVSLQVGGKATVGRGRCRLLWWRN